MQEKPNPCDHVVPIEEEPRHHLVVANEFVRAFAVEIAPHDCTLCHHHAHDYLMYVAGDAQIVSAPRDGEPKTHTYHDGDCEASPAGLAHIVENLTDTSFRNLLVEFLPGLGELQRGADPRITIPNGVVETIFEEGRISVWSLELDPGAQAEADGPAIVATPYGERLVPKDPGDITVKADNVHNMGWIASDRCGLVRNQLERPLRAIVFQLGRTEEQLAAVRKRAGEPIKSLRAHADEPE
jgi:hypothetical protein